MRYVGLITEWNDDKGYGFVTPDGGGNRVFVHIKALERRFPRPVIGEQITYDLLKDEQGRLNAADVRYATETSSNEVPAVRGLRRKAVAVLPFVALGFGWLAAKIPASIALTYSVMSLFAILLYAKDKSAAVNSRWRTQESTLHVVALSGGWPGALFAQQVFRHKSKKIKFQSVFWFTVVLNCVGLAWLLASGKYAAIEQAVREAFANS